MIAPSATVAPGGQASSPLTRLSVSVNGLPGTAWPAPSSATPRCTAAVTTATIADDDRHDDEEQDRLGVDR